jgi:hypothetical protein
VGDLALPSRIRAWYENPVVTSASSRRPQPRPDRLAVEPRAAAEVRRELLVRSTSTTAPADDLAVEAPTRC